ncbi:MAG TPA: hypothetical protein VHW23_35885 [Kofleriaceae bacterium]|jgi:hypothetical protein|nr:hypothetical protein [Kofleriaceae bacterium]
MITAIFVKEPATLTFATSENLFLEEMAQPSRRTPLTAGQNTVVQVGSGVFKVHSTTDVSVSASTTSVRVAVSPQDKDGGNDPPKLLVAMTQLMPDMDVTSVRQFLFATFGSPIPT